jgi:GNAT superfamily N-acetyltransferase
VTDPNIRALIETDWGMLRELRLRALEDSPDSFGPTVTSALAQPESYWRAWALGRPARLQAWIAYHNAEPSGLVSASVDDGGGGHFGALWVAPEARRGGIGEALVETACAWLETLGCPTIELHVTDGNSAERLYESLGFARTGARHALRQGSPLFEVTMARATRRDG